jgi:SAM-dependent methyltransferase
MTHIEYNGRDNLEVMLEAKKYNKYLFDLILSNARKGELIVDFGAGSGTFCLPVVAEGYRVVCVETDPLLANSLLEQGLEVVTRLETIEDESIDYLYTLNVLEHIEDDEAMARLWFQKLKKGGQLLVYVPAFQALYTSMDRKVGHYRRYTKQMLSTKLVKAGFEIDELKYADSLGYLVTLLYKAFDNGGGDVDLRALKIYDKWIFPLSRFLDLVAHPFIGKNVYVRALKRL